MEHSEELSDYDYFISFLFFFSLLTASRFEEHPLLLGLLPIVLLLYPSTESSSPFLFLLSTVLALDLLVLFEGSCLSLSSFTPFISFASANYFLSSLDKPSNAYLASSTISD